MALCSSFQVPFITMYRKEECLSLFKDPEQHEAGDENQNDDENQNQSDKKPKLRWHKVN